MSSRCAGLLYLQSEQSIAPLLKACELFGVEDRKSLPLCAIRTHLLCDKNCPAANDCNPCVSIFSPLKRAWAFTHSQLSRGSYTLTSKHTHTHADIFPFLSFFLSFFLFRCFSNQIHHSTLFKMPLAVTEEEWSEAVVYTWYTTNTFLIALWLLNIYWLKPIIRLFFRNLTGLDQGKPQDNTITREEKSESARQAAQPAAAHSGKKKN